MTYDVTLTELPAWTCGQPAAPCGCLPGPMGKHGRCDERHVYVCRSETGEEALELDLIGPHRSRPVATLTLHAVYPWGGPEYVGEKLAEGPVTKSCEYVTGGSCWIEVWHGLASELLARTDGSPESIKAALRSEARELFADARAERRPEVERCPCCEGRGWRLGKEAP